MKQASTGVEIWTYPFLVPGFRVPRWCLAHISPDGILREKNMIDDPTRAQR